MSEKIKNLITAIGTDTSEKWMSVANVELLIESIINECADVVKNNVMNISTYADAEYTDDQIKQHFGVK